MHALFPAPDTSQSRPSYTVSPSGQRTTIRHPATAFSTATSFQERPLGIWSHQISRAQPQISCVCPLNLVWLTFEAVKHRSPGSWIDEEEMVLTIELARSMDRVGTEVSRQLLALQRSEYTLRRTLLKAVMLYCEGDLRETNSAPHNHNPRRKPLWPGGGRRSNQNGKV